MLQKMFLNEFEFELANTLKLLKAIPDDKLDYKLQPQLWSVAQLASHIAEIYNWYDLTFNMNEFAIDKYVYDKGDLTKAANIVAKLEENASKARLVLENLDETKLKDNWTMTHGGNVVFGPMTKLEVARGFLYNHLYHHRGQLTAYLRAAGCQIPALYGNAYQGPLG